MNELHLSFEKAIARVASLTNEMFQVESITLSAHGPFDGQMFATWRGEQRVLEIYLKSSTTNASIAQLAVNKEKAGRKDWLLLTGNISPSVRKSLRELSINYLDAAGNCYLTLNDSVVLIEGQKQQKEISSPNRSRVFRKTGLKLILHVLELPNQFDATFRELAANASISLGSVQYIIDGLEDLGYIRRTSESEYRIIERERLLREWAESYDLVLRPGISRGRFKFVVPKEREEWSKTWFGHHAYWSGATAAFRNNMLAAAPSDLTMYSSISLRVLNNVFHVVPDKNGDLEVVQAFWDQEIDDAAELRAESSTLRDVQNAPLPVIYADLVRHGDPRLNEVAETLLEDYLTAHD